MPNYEHIAVIGAGIVGLSTAIWLQRFGCHVTLIDQDGPGAGASFGNGGVIADLAVVPVATPGIWKKAPGMLLNRNQPLFLKWQYLPKLLPYLRDYLGSSAAPQVEKTAKALHLLLHDARDQHEALAQGTSAASLIGAPEYLYVYSDKSGYEADAYGWSLRRKHGYELVELNAEALSAFDPALADRFGFGVLSRTSGVILDPGAYIDALHAHFIEQGGVQRTMKVGGFAEKGDLALSATSSAEAVAADGFVVTTGAWSGPLAKDLGVQVRLESERGYHIEFHDPNVHLRAPVMIAEAKFVLTPMNGRLRAAGIVEFGGLELPASQAPFDLLRREVKRVLPGLTYSHTTEWMGHRPAPSDSIPIIGQSPRLRNVYLGYGHHHVGLTGGPKTGRWIAQTMMGHALNEDIDLFSPARRTKN